MKIGRNEPCWYGSGKKYKKRHLGREKAALARAWEMDAHLRSQRKIGACLHVGDTAVSICGKPAIGSHTVPKQMRSESPITGTFTSFRPPKRI
jgi:SEC-C motif